MSGSLAIILARAGSRGVPGKNRAMVGGRPCVAWTIGDAFAAEKVDQVVVTTDDPAVAKAAVEMGARVIDRPSALAGDRATVDDALRHACEEIDPDPESPIALLYGNVPVRPAGLIDGAIGLLVSSGCDSVQSYAPVGKHHPCWMVRVDAKGSVTAWEGGEMNGGIYRRQDLPAAYLPDGGVAVMTQDALFRRMEGVGDGPHAFFGRDRRAVMTGEGQVVDIDSPLDLLVADTVLRTTRAGARAVVGA